MYQLRQIPSEAQAKKYLRRAIFGKNVFCPECQGRKVVRYGERYRCKTCRIKFSLLSHTWLSNMKLPHQKFWLLLWAWTIKMPVLQAMALSRLSEKAVRHWYREFRMHLPEEVHVLERVVQMDEAFFKKMTLIMAKQKGTRKLAWQVLPGTAPTKTDAAYFLFQKVKPGSQLWTDGGGIYKGISKQWPVRHSTDIHKRFEFAHTSEIEGIFGVYRTFVRKMYHHHRAENLPEYVREFCFRFSSPELFQNPLFYIQKSLSLVPTG